MNKTLLIEYGIKPEKVLGHRVTTKNRLLNDVAFALNGIPKVTGSRFVNVYEVGERLYELSDICRMKDEEARKSRYESYLTLKKEFE